jgi:hypothetical protein
MGTEIGRLWWWEPSPDMNKESEENRLQLGPGITWHDTFPLMGQTRTRATAHPWGRGVSRIGEWYRCWRPKFTQVTSDAWDVQTADGTEDLH